MAITVRSVSKSLILRGHYCCLLGLLACSDPGFDQGPGAAIVDAAVPSRDGSTSGQIDGGDGGLISNNDSGVVRADGGNADASSPAARFTSLVIEPASARLTVQEQTPTTADFRVFGIASDGSRTDISTLVAASVLDRSLGQSSNAQGVVRFTAAGTRGGTTKLRAAFQTLTVEANIELSLTIVEGDSNAPILSVAVDPDQNRSAATIVYPLDGVLVPPNLSNLEVHFERGSTADQNFNIRFEMKDRLSVNFVTTCETLGAGCRFVVPRNTWDRISSTVAGFGPLNIYVDSMVTNGTNKSVSTPVQIELAAQSVHGGLYYWTTSNNGVIMRVDFAQADQAPPQRFYPRSSGTCYGCHSLAPNGERMTLSSRGQGEGLMTLLQLTENQAPAATIDNGNYTDAADVSRGQVAEQFQSWRSDSSRFVAVFPDDSIIGVQPQRDELRIYDGANGRLLETIDVASRVSHVDWSPVEDRIAFVNPSMPYTAQRFIGGRLQYIQHDSASGQWSQPISIDTGVGSDQSINEYTPAFSLDGSFLVYARSQCTSNLCSQLAGAHGSTFCECNADADPSSRLMAVLKDGGTAIDLTNVNTPGPTDLTDGYHLANTFPKWSPFEIDRYASDNTTATQSKIVWMTFSSRRRFGVRPPVFGREADRDNPDHASQSIWMVAVDSAKILRGEDGSFAPFILPFQDLDTSNHLAQWTQVIVPDDNPPVNQCVPVGDSCVVGGTSCCSGECVAGDGSGVCTVPDQCVAEGNTCIPNVSSCCVGECITIGGASTCQLDEL